MIDRRSRGVADDNMPDRCCSTPRESPPASLVCGRARLVLAVLKRHGVAPPAKVVDVGCGWGVTLDVLEAAGYGACGLDISRQILERIDRPNRQLIEADLNQKLPPEAGINDGLLSLDVIEHIDDDVWNCQTHGSIGFGQAASPSSVCPPFQSSMLNSTVSKPSPPLCSRAVARSIRRKHLAVQEIFWWGAWMVPIVRRSRKSASSANKTYADYLRLPPWPFPWLARLAYAWEHSRALEGKLRIGTSLFAVARRASNGAVKS